MKIKHINIFFKCSLNCSFTIRTPRRYHKFVVVEVEVILKLSSFIEQTADRQYTDIATYRPNRPRSQLSKTLKEPNST